MLSLWLTHRDSTSRRSPPPNMLPLSPPGDLSHSEHCEESPETFHPQRQIAVREPVELLCTWVRATRASRTPARQYSPHQLARAVIAPLLRDLTSSRCPWQYDRSLCWHRHWERRCLKDLQKRQQLWINTQACLMSTGTAYGQALLKIWYAAVRWLNRCQTLWKIRTPLWGLSTSENAACRTAADGLASSQQADHSIEGSKQDRAHGL